MLLERMCGQFRLLIQRRLFRNASMSVHVPPGGGGGGFSSRGPPVCLAGLCSRMLVQRRSLLGTLLGAAAHSRPASPRSLCTSVQPPRDVTLFEHNRTHFFRLLSAFCGCQFFFWTYLAHFAYTGLRNTRGTTEKGKNVASTTTNGLAGMWSIEMNLGSNTWRYSFTMGCLAVGAMIVGLGVLFCRRSVCKVVLHQGGKMVTVCTQSPLGAGRGQRITVPLQSVGCYAHRLESNSFIPLKVKGHKFYFLLDKEGTVSNTKLFDITVGAYRPI